MVRISDGDIQQQWGKIRDLTVTEPVTITRNGQDEMVLLSAKEYERLKRRDRRVMTLADFTKEDLDAIRKVEPSPESAAFNHELKD